MSNLLSTRKYCPNWVFKIWKWNLQIELRNCNKSIYFSPKKVWDTHLPPWYESHGRRSKCIKPKLTGTAMAVKAKANAKTAKQMVVCRSAGGKIMTNVVIYWKWLRGKYLAITHLVQTNWAQRRKFPVTFFCQKYCPTFLRANNFFVFSSLKEKIIATLSQQIPAFHWKFQSLQFNEKAPIIVWMSFAGKVLWHAQVFNF